MKQINYQRNEEMNFENWKKAFKKHFLFYFTSEASSGMKINGFYETNDEYQAFIEDDNQTRQIVITVNKNVFIHLDQKLSPLRAKAEFIIEIPRDGVSDRFDFAVIYSGKELLYSFSSFIFDEEDNENEYTMYCHLKRGMKFDDFTIDEKTAIREISSIVENMFKTFYKPSAIIIYDKDFGYFLNDVPQEDRYRMEIDLNQFMASVEATYYKNLKDAHLGLDIENVTDYMTEGLAYEKRSVGYKNPVYDAAYLWKLIELNKKANFEDEKFRENIIRELKWGLDIAFKKTNDKQREELKQFGITNNGA
jgi:hypothetical protein